MRAITTGAALLPPLIISLEWDSLALEIAPDAIINLCNALRHTTVSQQVAFLNGVTGRIFDLKKAAEERYNVTLATSADLLSNLKSIELEEGYRILRRRNPVTSIPQDSSTLAPVVSRATITLWHGLTQSILHINPMYGCSQSNAVVAHPTIWHNFASLQALQVYCSEDFDDCPILIAGISSGVHSNSLQRLSLAACQTAAIDRILNWAGQVHITHLMIEYSNSGFRIDELFKRCSCSSDDDCTCENSQAASSTP
ncbi:hypothetical protein BKA62DRAFT_726189 [Auriculariales sp. MPI-PUGE-AT-0066]|nr:hypothetical protein BKA62DRAFT_726189 [Auriculariales sp. MPI-PUGE-AT-0066]